MTNHSQNLSLPRPLVNKILAHAQNNPDIEVCGLIGNSATMKKTYYPIDNISTQPSCRFIMDAPQQIAAMKKMRGNKQQLFAIIHSHPNATASPSQRDINESAYKDAYYIIISLNTKGVLEMRAYKQLQESMLEINLVLEDS